MSSGSPAQNSTSPRPPRARGSWRRTGLVALVVVALALVSAGPGWSKKKPVNPPAPPPAAPPAAPPAPSGYDPASDVNSMLPTDALHRRAGLVGRRLHRHGRRHRGDRRRRLQGCRAWTAATRSSTARISRSTRRTRSSRYLDSNGHGTFMAGLIAANGSALTLPTIVGRHPPNGDGAGRPDRERQGRRPTARSDVTQVIAAIDWVVQHRTTTA